MAATNKGNVFTPKIDIASGLLLSVFSVWYVTDLKQNPDQDSLPLPVLLLHESLGVWGVAALLALGSVSCIHSGVAGLRDAKRRKKDAILLLGNASPTQWRFSAPPGSSGRKAVWAPDATVDPFSRQIAEILAPVMTPHEYVLAMAKVRLDSAGFWRVFAKLYLIGVLTLGMYFPTVPWQVLVVTTNRFLVIDLDDSHTVPLELVGEIDRDDLRLVSHHRGILWTDIRILTALGQEQRIRIPNKQAKKYGDIVAEILRAAPECEPQPSASTYS